MLVNTNSLFSMSEANQNFSRIAREVDEKGTAVILKNNVPRYLIIDFSQAESAQAAEDEDVMEISKRLIQKNRGACQVKRLSKRQVVMLHEQLIRETGGTAGIRDDGLLESALEAPFQEFGGVSVYPSVQQKAARLGFGLVKNHPFVDGNKRIGAHAMLVFLELNGIELNHTSEELSEIILKLAAGDADLQSLLSWILEHQA